MVGKMDGTEPAKLNGAHPGSPPNAGAHNKYPQANPDFHIQWCIFFILHKYDNISQRPVRDVGITRLVLVQHPIPHLGTFKTANFNVQAITSLQPLNKRRFICAVIPGVLIKC